MCHHRNNPYQQRNKIHSIIFLLSGKKKTPAWDTFNTDVRSKVKNPVDANKTDKNMFQYWNIDQ